MCKRFELGSQGRNHVGPCWIMMTLSWHKNKRWTLEGSRWGPFPNARAAGRDFVLLCLRDSFLHLKMRMMTGWKLWTNSMQFGQIVEITSCSNYIVDDTTEHIFRLKTQESFSLFGSILFFVLKNFPRCWRLCIRHLTLNMIAAFHLTLGILLASTSLIFYYCTIRESHHLRTFSKNKRIHSIYWHMKRGFLSEELMTRHLHSIFFFQALQGSVQANYDPYSKEYRRIDEGLTHIPQDIPAETEKLRLEINSITEVPPGALSHLNNLTLLYLDQNSITDISASSFTGLDSLESLDLSGNDLSSIPQGTFSDLHQLKYLYLAVLPVPNLSDISLDGLDSLEVLILSHNNFTNVPNEYFSSLKNLKTLRMRHNQFTNFPRGAFSGLDSLTELSLSSNLLQTIPGVDFSGLTLLNMLELSDNKISHISAEDFANFRELDHFEKLYLRKNGITSLQTGVFVHLQRLTELWLLQNKISHISSEHFRGLNSLEILRLDANDISEIPDGAFSNLGQLKQLVIKENSISEISLGTFEGLDHLETLDLSSNNLGEILPHTFAGLPDLQSLSLRNNHLSQLPNGMLENQASLEKFDASENILISLPPSLFSETHELTNIGLSFNKLSSIPPELFAETYKVFRLDLSNNELSFLPPGLLAGNYAHAHLYLHLWNNQLETLPDLFGPREDPSLTFRHVKLIVVNNPLQFDSRLSWLQEAIQEGFVSCLSLPPYAQNKTIVFPDIHAQLMEFCGGDDWLEYRTLISLVEMAWKSCLWHISPEAKPFLCWYIDWKYFSLFWICRQFVMPVGWEMFMYLYMSLHIS